VNLGDTTPPAGSVVTTAQFTLAVYAQGNSQPLFTSSNQTAALSLSAGTNYTFTVTSNVSGQVTMTATNYALPGLAPVVTTLNQGANTVSLPVAGNYYIKLAMATTNPGTAQYTAQVSCSNPSQLDLSGASVTATPAAGNNLFTFAASGIAGGQGPYQCAWDFNGDGLTDTLFTPCVQGVAGAYVPYVGTHQVGLLVLDACANTAHQEFPGINFPSNPPSPLPSGQTFIQANVTGSSTTATTDLRDVQNGTGVSTLWTNQEPVYGGVVQAMFNQGNSGGTFTIKSDLRYTGTSSLDWGDEFDIGGITGSADPATLTSTLAILANAPMTVSVTTDQAGDAEPEVTYQGNCTLNNATIQSMPAAGTPCTGAGLSGDQNEITVEVSGTYTGCLLQASNGSSITISGEVDGVYRLQDSCIGGGGQEGGGVDPVEL